MAASSAKAGLGWRWGFNVRLTLSPAKRLTVQIRHPSGTLADINSGFMKRPAPAQTLDTVYMDSCGIGINIRYIINLDGCKPHLEMTPLRYPGSVEHEHIIVVPRKAWAQFADLNQRACSNH
jgi:hypothetical protein